MRSTPILVIISLLLATAAVAQTPGTVDLDSLAVELCARDSLYIISPDVVDLELQEEGRFGLMLSWDDLPLETATCFALRGVDTLSITASASGGFGDRVDRLLRFTTTGEGMVGADQPGELVLGWRNVGDSTYGNLAGYLNLANNGGIVGWNQSASGWDKTNVGLPVTWRQVNVVDLDIAEDDVMYAAFSAGTTTEAQPRGVWRHNGTGWTRLAEDRITDSIVVTAVAVAPNNSDRIAVGTSLSGLFVSSDGGQTYTQWTVELDPTLDPQPENFRVTALDWTGSQLSVAVRTLGLFISNDNGATFTRSDLLVPDDLDKISPTFILPQINELITDTASVPNRILASLQFHGCYQSTDGGLTWQDLYGDLLVPDPDDNGAWVRSALSVAVDPNNPQTLVMGVEQWGLYQTTNDGLNWTLVGDNVQPDAGQLRWIKMLADPATNGRILAMEDGWSLLVSDDSGLTWTHFPVQPTLNSMLTLAAKASGDGGNFFVGTWKGGLYEAGTPITLSDTYSTETSPELRDMNLGLDLTIDSGTLSDHAGDPNQEPDRFELVGQTFQGWCVWRSTADNPDTMTMIGKYDRVNPESCIEGFCGDTNFQPLPQCFHTTRAGCFDFTPPLTEATAPGELRRIRFFDDEVYNAFRYHYAVTTFDYANTAEVSPETMPRSMIISPRWPTQEAIDAGDWRRDPVSIFSPPPYLGAGNRQALQLDRSAPGEGEEADIYVFPNPLRNDAGIPGEEGRTVIFTNLPEGSRVRVFTTAGDDVADLTTDLMSGGQIRWGTTNRDNESVAAGVYLYKVESPNREATWGRLVIIR